MNPTKTNVRAGRLEFCNLSVTQTYDRSTANNSRKIIFQRRRGYRGNLPSRRKKGNGRNGVRSILLHKRVLFWIAKFY
jgi:hypothetical protein